MGGFQPHEQVDVVGHAADAFGKTAQPANRPAEIFVETRPPFRRDQGFTVFRAEDEMVMEAEVGRGHKVRAGIPPGCGIYFVRFPVVSARSASTTG
jgi:hypothetical protein